MTKANDKKNSQHHYLQRSYLNLFAIDEAIDVVDRESGTVRRNVNTKETAKIRGLYTGIDSTGNQNGGMEDAFSTDIEEPGIRVIKNMTTIFPFIPKGIDKNYVSSYMALQYLRTPEMKRKFQADFGLYSSIELFNKMNDDKELKRILKSQNKPQDDKHAADLKAVIKDGIDNYELIPHNNSWLTSIANSIEHIAKIIYEEFKWHLLITADDSFITSDHPIILRRIHQDFRGVGFKTADELIFPISKRHLLLLSKDDSVDTPIMYNPDKDFIKSINSMQASGSYLDYFSPPSVTETLDIKPLGIRAITTVDSPINIDFIKKYTGVLNNHRPYR